MDEEQFDALVDDIKQNGLREAIWLHAGAIIDGRNRYLACQKLGIEPRFSTWDGKGSLTAFVMSLNLARRHLTKSQRAMVAVDALPLLEAEAKERQRAGAVRGGKQSSARQSDAKVPEKIPEPCAAESRQEAARVVNVNDRYVSDAKRIQQEAPQVAAKVRSGELTLQDAKRELKVEQQKRTAEVAPWPPIEQQLRERLERGETVVVNVQTMAHVTGWARERGLLVMVDRTTEWGNPFKLGDDGERAEVVEKYRRYYLPHKNKLRSMLSSLKGKALGCHCAPAGCHADAIMEALK
jgi:ParB-like chromosome segregation protein Spo0J